MIPPSSPTNPSSATVPILLLLATHTINANSSPPPTDQLTTVFPFYPVGALQIVITFLDHRYKSRYVYCDSSSVSQSV
ncbi:uncharacterized protein EAE98_007916 [Botrytis deweyae]|uniref:Secreted protein n=1 Tax=Botrytis deweyae TaxID=2478750 RepID=A0ABQ7IGD7_9HELO|nr:uncharacterized protein EAE98_007916 [Botrytis deweyae]KAF7923211.1 hypothetical protein EAE98_007916 [Botrytis deweyae]